MLAKIRRGGGVEEAPPPFPLKPLSSSSSSLIGSDVWRNPITGSFRETLYHKSFSGSGVSQGSSFAAETSFQTASAATGHDEKDLAEKSGFSRTRGDL